MGEIKNFVGQMKIRVASTGLKPQFLKSGAQSIADLKLSDELIMDCGNNVRINPEHMIMYNHPSNTKQIQIIDGSGHFFVNSTTESTFYTYAHKAGLRTITVQPMVIGEG